MKKQTKSKEQIEHIRHSLAHLLAAAILKLWPDTKLTIGPSTDEGFYYDFEFSENISEKDLPKIEKTMKKILPTWDKFSHQEVSEAEALKKYSGNPYKTELIKEISGKKEKITLYTSGEFTDLCRGGHVESTKNISPDSFKLDRLAGAYWRGDEKNQMLTRIYGLAFSSKEELDSYIHTREEAKKRDHKILGPKLDLFMFHHTSPGMPYWLPKGVELYNELLNFWRIEHKKRGYLETVSPILNKKELYVTSGHYDHYWENMFVCTTSEDEEYGVKAMNCPNAHVIYSSKPRSYRDLPLRLGDTDTLHRFELSGTLNGLLRVREFRQDDAHIYVAEEQIESEYNEVFDIVERFYSIFGMQYSYRLGTRPDSYMGDLATWNRAEETLKKILKDCGKDFWVEEGDGAFYGPKVDILMRDALGRQWQMGTIQLDFQQPKRFELEYTAEDGSKKTPIAIHRVVYGSLERFIGILIEHYAGAFPLWISPVQAAVLPVSDKFGKYAKEVADRLIDCSIRAELDSRNESVGKKIREAELQKTPYMLVVGEKEAGDGTVTVRKRGEKDQVTMKLEKFIELAQEKIKSKSTT